MYELFIKDINKKNQPLINSDILFFFEYILLIIITIIYLVHKKKKEKHKFFSVKSTVNSIS